MSAEILNHPTLDEIAKEQGTPNYRAGAAMRELKAALDELNDLVPELAGMSWDFEDRRSLTSGELLNDFKSELSTLIYLIERARRA